MPDILTNSEIPRELPAEIKPDSSRDKLKSSTPDEKSDELKIPAALPSTPETDADLSEAKTAEIARHFMVTGIVDMRKDRQKRVEEAGMGQGQDPLGDQTVVRRAFEEPESQNPNA